jgi:hypothetical protein
MQLVFSRTVVGRYGIMPGEGQAVQPRCTRKQKGTSDKWLLCVT